MSEFVKSADEIQKMRVACRMAASVLEMITPHVLPGVTTEALDKRCHDFIVDTLQARPACLGYHGYPKTICASVNHQVCHGIPSEKKLKKGDIVNIDVTVEKDGYHGDSSKMFIVGEGSVLANRLVGLTREALFKGIEVVKPGATIGDIGATIEAFAHKNRLSVVREYCGHGIGESMHEDPQITHYGKAGTGTIIEEGMTFTIEPMLNAGKRHVSLLKDEWTVVTKDRSLSAQWEHTLLVTKTGCEILTLREEETDVPEHLRPEKVALA